MQKTLVIFLLCLLSKTYGNSISEAYKALSQYDYFKAKKVFYKSIRKYPSESAFGLATIYFRTDNPFSNIDSAAKYINKAKQNFADSVTYSSYHLNINSISNLSSQISLKGFKVYCENGSIQTLNHFLNQYYFSNDSLLHDSYLKRDRLCLVEAAKFEKSKDVEEFIKSYPQSELLKEASQLFNLFQYNEVTPEKSINQLKNFIANYPQNTLKNDAESKLFNLIQQLHSSESLYEFVKLYSSSLTTERAWRLLYSMSVKSYNQSTLNSFLQKYPDYPFSEEVIKEISLTQKILLPIKNSDGKYGFIDTLGNWQIKPKFDDAYEFSEGYAVVCKNDSCFYINKEGEKAYDSYFDEADAYKNGAAVVKKGKLFFLVNRFGQIITKGYEDLNGLSNKLYVCKTNGFYGAINNKGETIIPFEYSKLGNFKNNFAYYISTFYGLVDVHNKTTEPKWDWISDVDTNMVVVVKKQNKFGLLTVDDQVILNAEYDYISHCQNDIYLLQKNNYYGFYNLKEKCFITNIEFDYNSACETSYYTNGKQFKLLKNNEVALMDVNGKYSINYKTYSNIYFAKCDVIRVQKNNKFGFVDRRLKAVTNFEFDSASDFENNLAIVKKDVNTQLINTLGKSIFLIKNGDIEYLDFNLYKVSQNELVGLIDETGKSLLKIEYDNIEPIFPSFYLCTKNNELYLFNKNTFGLTKL
jgi:hypothetical protein